MATEQVIVEFIPDFSQLDSAFQKLSQSGTIDKATAQAFTETNKAIQEESQSVSELKKQFDDLKTTATKMGASVEQAFSEGVNDALQESGVSLDEFNEKLNKGTKESIKPVLGLKAELKALTLSIAEAKAKGSPIDPIAIKRAGQLKDAIADANAEIKNAGSDTKNLDNVVGSIGALAGGFAAVQGAAALFGGANEDLQKSLLKVNAAMAIAQGFQQVANALQAEGALRKLADVVATTSLTVAQTAYNVVVGTSTGLLKGLRIAFAATGIGAFIFLVYELVTALQSQNDELEDAEDLIKSQNSLLDLNNSTIKKNTDLELARAKAIGKAESEIMRIRGRSLNLQIDALDEQNKRLAQERNQMDKTSEGWFKLNEQIEQNNDTRKSLINETQILGIELTKQEVDERQDAEDKKLKASEDAARKLHEQKMQELKDNVAILETQLLNENLFVTERLDLEKKLIDAKAALQIESAKKTAAELGLIEAQSAKDRFDAFKTAAQEQRDALLTVDLTAQKKKSDEIKKDVVAANADLLKIVETDSEKRIKKDDDDRKAQKEKIKKDNEESQAAFKESFEKTAEGALQLLNLFSEFASRQSDAALEKIDEEREHTDALLEAGAITEKDAKQRMLRLDAEEKKVKREQAKRDKEIALFQAAIQMSLSILKASPDPVSIALAIALGIANIALIASKPLPKFATGKKGSYKGLGIAGEAGAELVQQGGRFHLVSKPTALYLNPEDKIYTAGETKKMLENIDASLYKHSAKNDSGIDYEKLGEAIANRSKNISININKDFIAESVADGLNYNRYFNKRYSSK